MPLDNSTDTLLKNIAAQGGPALHEMPVDICRTVFLELVQNLQGDMIEIHHTEDLEISSLEASFPRGAAWAVRGTGGAGPLLLWLWNGVVFVDEQWHLCFHL